MSRPELAITGATGFIGQHCVAQAREQNITVRAFARDPQKVPTEWLNDAGVEVVLMDLTTPGEALENAFKGMRCVVHCAATMVGNHDRDTLAASVAVIDAVIAAQVPHVVLAGSLSVYDVTQIPNGGLLDESSPLGTEGRDAYAQAKQRQESLFQDGALLFGYELSILRLGAVWGPGQLFSAHIGPAAGSLLMVIDGGGTVPLCRVDLAAEALIKASQVSTGVGTLNIVDDALPSRRAFVKAFRACGWPKFSLRWPLTLWRVAAVLTPNGPKVPGLLRRAVLEARHRPLSYSNAAMHKRLGPVTMLPFETAMQAAIEQQNTQAPSP